MLSSTLSLAASKSHSADWLEDSRSRSAHLKSRTAASILLKMDTLLGGSST